jgi:hypothetical protein
MAEAEYVPMPVQEPLVQVQAAAPPSQVTVNAGIGSPK